MVHLVPAHLRHLEAAAVGLQPALEIELDHLAGDQAQTVGRPFVAACPAASACRTHTPNSGLLAAASSTESIGPLSRAARACSRAWRPGPAAPRGRRRARPRVGRRPTRPSRRTCRRAAARPATRSAGCPCRSRPRRRSFAIRPGGAKKVSEPLVEGMTPAERGSSSSATRSARANALNTVSHWWGARCRRAGCRCARRDDRRGWRSPGRIRTPAALSKAPIMPLVKGTRIDQARAGPRSR